MNMRIIFEHTPVNEDGSLDKEFWVKIWRLRQKENINKIMQFVIHVVEGKYDYRS